MLETLKEELREYKVVDCGLWHEQVERIGSTMVPKLASQSVDVRYKRVKFCEKEIRDHLGCAHTAIRSIAVDKVEAITKLLLEKAGTDAGLITEIKEISSKYRETIKALELKIIETDIEKSRLELEHAEVCEKISQNETPALLEALSKVEENIVSVILQQKRCNVEIRTLQAETLAAIDAMEIKLG